MAGYKVFADGEVLDASEVNGYLMDQVVGRVTSGSRPSSPGTGQIIYETDTGKHMQWNGSTWIPFPDIPEVQLILPANQSTSNNSETPVYFGAGELRDTHGFHTPSFSSRITPTKAGRYRFDAHVFWENDPDGVRSCVIGKNGVGQQPAQRDQWGQNWALSQSVGRTLSMNGSGDYAELLVFQTAGAALNVLGDNAETNTAGTMFECRYLRPL